MTKEWIAIPQDPAELAEFLDGLKVPNDDRIFMDLFLRVRSIASASTLPSESEKILDAFKKIQRLGWDNPKASTWYARTIVSYCEGIGDRTLIDDVMTGRINLEKGSKHATTNGYGAEGPLKRRIKKPGENRRRLGPRINGVPEVFSRMASAAIRPASPRPISPEQRAYLDKLPLYHRLGGNNRKFNDDARTFYELADTIAAMREIIEDKMGKNSIAVMGPFYRIVDDMLSAGNPLNWTACTACDGSGFSAGNRCGKCKSHGYTIT